MGSGMQHEMCCHRSKATQGPRSAAAGSTPVCIRIHAAGPRRSRRGLPWRVTPPTWSGEGPTLCAPRGCAAALAHPAQLHASTKRTRTHASNAAASERSSRHSAEESRGWLAHASRRRRSSCHSGILLPGRSTFRSDMRKPCCHGNFSCDHIQ
eukprot:CAMPEP_0119091170 /NCGR_PEP_ID=MMETSP1178-20130426/155357_1 /TAXON_ID=33656 /ORGANISM="unid sp, Strain CCMP2000" /LENGTH=152 /DNA_ID=CAMNT_0007074647 /DNA_START=115 /DNA_END=573 /DNA_ORIENTATION=-